MHTTVSIPVPLLYDILAERLGGCSMRPLWMGRHVRPCSRGHRFADLRDAQWHHLAWVRDKAKRRWFMYIDGSPEPYVLCGSGVRRVPTITACASTALNVLKPVVCVSP